MNERAPDFHGLEPLLCDAKRIADVLFMVVEHVEEDIRANPFLRSHLEDKIDAVAHVARQVQDAVDEARDHWYAAFEAEKQEGDRKSVA